MTITRIQFIMGDASQGEVIPGEVQGVKQGEGVLIGSDGRISFQASTAPGVLKTNNPVAFNLYNWPVNAGSSGQFFGAGSSNNPTWSVPVSLAALGTVPPAGPQLGRMWFDYSEDLLSVFQNKDSSGSWKNSSLGLNPVLGNVTCFPPFSGGNGTQEDPYIIATLSSVSGETVIIPETVTITGLAPFQYLPIDDVYNEDNGYRFQASNKFADFQGNLTFRLFFTDSPKTLVGSVYSSLIKVGFDSPVFLEAAVEIISGVSILDPGSISGTAQVGEVLTYTIGTATGGVPPYSYSWVWKAEKSGNVLQVDGSTYVIAPEASGDRIYVELRAEDSLLEGSVGVTPYTPQEPAVVDKSNFPNTNILFPATTTSSIPTLWIDEGATLNADGCIEFSTDGVNFGQGPAAISNGGTLTTRWSSASSCSGSANGSIISGCIFSPAHRQCSSLTVDRIPSPFSFPPVTEIALSSVATSSAITLTGYNSLAYITRGSSSTGTNIEASIDGGVSWLALPLSGTSVSISPGQTLHVRLTTGPTLGASYSAVINVGEGASVQSTTFTATNTTSTNFATPVTFPTNTISEVASSAWLAGDGSTSLTATGCIQFKVGVGGSWAGAGDPPVAITTGNILYTRWSNSTPGVCGSAVHGTAITGTITNVPSGGSKTNSATLTIDRVPAMFTFSDLTGQAVSSVVTSNVINIEGINAPTYITKGAATLGSFEASVGGGAWTAIPSSGETLAINPPGAALQIRGTTGSSSNTAYTAVINIGQGTSVNTDTWSVTTTAAVPSIVTPSIVTPANGAQNLNPYSVTPAGITITSSTYSGINGAGSHTGSDWEVYYLSGSTPVYISQVTNSPTSLTSLFIPVANLVAGRTYYARVKYRATSPSILESSWSNVSQFAVSSTFTLGWYQTAFTDTLSSTSAYGRFRFAVNPISGVIVATSDMGGFRSTNGGTEWSNSPSGALTGWTSIAYGSNLFVITRRIASGPAAGSIHYYSNDSGVSWVQVSNSPLNSYNIRAITYSDTLNLFCAVGDSGATFTATPSAITSGGWVPRTSGTNENLYSVIWDGSSFRSCGGTAYLTSSNGVSWTQTTIPLPPTGEGLYQIAKNSNSGIYIMTRLKNPAESYPNSVLAESFSGMISSNGSTWSTIQFPTFVGEVAAGGNWFLLSSLSSRRIFTSVNGGTSWNQSVSFESQVPLNAGPNGTPSFVYHPLTGRFIFGTTELVYTSTYFRKPIYFRST